MTDILGYRAKFGVLGPSTNTTVQPEMDEMRPAGVTNHYSRIIVDNANALSDETFLKGTALIDQGTVDAVRGVMTCAPDYLVMGMSAITFYGGAKGAEQWQSNIEEVAGVKSFIGSVSVVEAFKAIGGIKKVAFLSPYYPVANTEVRNFLSDYGFETVADHPFRAPTWTAIAEITHKQVREVVEQMNDDNVDAILQVGTNLCMARLAGRLEQELNKPVVAINTATYWHALRANGITDKVSGFGRLLEEL
ncbi:hypothetical protein Q4520_07125 [Alteromonas sp. 1_MG-2023]|uniref:maleate cis-trans isomerase family protein n=1 Tax=Alteromonas sp. 1_MG-2023 TaxID=3062669 RepID=UPI0026E19583|nr:hypothetical protein [Alteromonas sp. 1_MG-2023]MDO6475184.1 hypothetical protein [Alteromonas sp. 1_MG-2023]